MNVQEGESSFKLRALRVSDFCQAYGLSRTTAYELMKSGRLKSVRIAGRRLIPVDEAEKLLTQAA